MAWAVFGRRIVINAEAKTLPFVNPAVKVANENKAEVGGHKNDEDRYSEGQEYPNDGERLIVLDFGRHRLASVVEAGDASGNIIRSRTQGGGPLQGGYGTTNMEPPCRIWMERVPSCLPSGQVHMSENMVVIVDVSGWCYYTRTTHIYGGTTRETMIICRFGCFEGNFESRKYIPYQGVLGSAARVTMSIRIMFVNVSLVPFLFTCICRVWPKHLNSKIRRAIGKVNCSTRA